MFTNTATTSAFNFGGTPGQATYGAGQTSAPSFLNNTQQQSQAAAMMSANSIPNDLLFNPKLFNDERDTIIGKFNRLQAYWGSGRAIYSSDGTNPQLLELNAHHSAHRFKGIAYSEIKRDVEDDKRVGVLVRFADESTLKTSILQYENSLKQMLGNMLVKVEKTKLLPGNKALLSFSVTDSSSNQRLPSQPVVNYLMAAKQQLPQVFHNNFIQLVPLTPTSKEEIEDYLSCSHQGVDPLIWNQAILENPDPERFIPVPLIGFQGLNDRFKLQEGEINQQKNRLQIISESVAILHRSIEASKAKLEECRRRNVPLRVKVLRAMIYQEIMRKRGFPVSPEEDIMRAHLEKLRTELSAPTKFRGSLNELMSRIRQSHSQPSSQAVGTLSEGAASDLKNHLRQEQQAISHLLSILKRDKEALSCIYQSSMQ